MLVYYPNILITESVQEPAVSQQDKLLRALGNMEYSARMIYQKEKGSLCVRLKKYLKFRGTIEKYKNTRKFLKDAYSLLS